MDNNNNNNTNNSDNNMNNKESGLSFKVFFTAFCGAMFMFLVFVAVVIGCFNSVADRFDDMSAQIEELSEDVNEEEGSCRVVTKTYAGVLDSVVTQEDGDEFDRYIIVGGSYVAVSELEYLKAKENIGKFVSVETESMEAKDADGDYTRTYSAIVTYEEDE